MRVGSTYTYFDELTFIDEELVIVFTSCYEYLCSGGCFESTALFRSTDQELIIEFEFDAGFSWVPGEES